MCHIRMRTTAETLTQANRQADRQTGKRQSTEKYYTSLIEFYMIDRGRGRNVASLSDFSKFPKEKEKKTEGERPMRCRVISKP